MYSTDKSTAINLRRLFLSMQTQADNMGNGTLLSLDAHNVFDRVE